MRKETPASLVTINSSSETGPNLTRVVIVGAGRELSEEMALAFAKIGVDVITQADAEHMCDASGNPFDLRNEIRPPLSEPLYRKNFKTGKRLRY